jgi:hypothetical protein
VTEALSSHIEVVSRCEVVVLEVTESILGNSVMIVGDLKMW